MIVPIVLIIIWILYKEDPQSVDQLNSNYTSDMDKYYENDKYDVDTGKGVATFASGCFWCMEAIMQETEGVEEVISGYAGGEEVDPTYEDVYKGETGHREAVQVFYDPNVISYEELLDIFWKNIDPTDEGGQFVDRGFSYTTAVFYHNDDQERAANESKKELSDTGKFEKPIVTKILPFTSFYAAEEYHQDYYQKSSTRYNLYKNASGREDFKEKIWQEIQNEKSSS